jgi:hypothetical protein
MSQFAEEKDYTVYTDGREFPYFTREKSSEIARHSEILALNASIERAWQAAIDREMRDAGFARVDDDGLAHLAVAVSEWGASAYTRNGLVACHGGDGWRIYAQGTGQFLAALPEQISVVCRFVWKAEQMMFWPLAGAIDAAQQSSLRTIAREAVEEEIALQNAATSRLKDWQLRHVPGAADAANQNVGPNAT